MSPPARGETRPHTRFARPGTQGTYAKILRIFSCSRRRSKPLFVLLPGLIVFCQCARREAAPRVGAWGRLAWGCRRLARVAVGHH